MFCGTGSFSHVDEDQWGPSTPKGSRKHSSKNPFSERGLDKFSMVLAELEARKEEIMARAGPQGASIVRFVYKNSEDWVPIIVRLREKPEKPAKPEKKAIAKSQQTQKKPEATGKESRSQSPPLESKATANNDVVRGGPVSNKTVKKSFSWNLKGGESGAAGSWLKWRPTYYWPVAMVLILLCLVLFGRVFAICCTSIWWYLVPTLEGESGDVRRSIKKKDFRRRLSDKKLGGQQVVSSAQEKKVGAVEGLGSPRHHHTNVKRG